MERRITDIGQYGIMIEMIEQATAALDKPIDSNTEYRDRQRQMGSTPTIATEWGVEKGMITGPVINSAIG